MGMTGTADAPAHTGVFHAEECELDALTSETEIAVAEDILVRLLLRGRTRSADGMRRERERTREIP